MSARRWTWILTLLWAAVIFTLSSVPGRAFPQVALLSYDKVLHAMVYGVLGALAWVALRGTWSMARAWAVLGATALAIAYGLTDEFHQRFVPGRSSDLYDV